jgi:hypothetical protein
VQTISDLLEQLVASLLASSILLQYTNKGMLLHKVLCDEIPCVCPLIDHGSRSKRLNSYRYYIKDRITTCSIELSGNKQCVHILLTNCGIFTRVGSSRTYNTLPGSRYESISKVTV